MGYLEGFRIPLQERLRRDIRTERYPDTIREKPERFHGRHVRTAAARRAEVAKTFAASASSKPSNGHH